MRTGEVKGRKRAIVLALGASMVAPSCWAGGTIDQTYVKSLAAPGKAVLVVEYYDPNGKVVNRKGFASATGFAVETPVQIAIDGKTSLHLYGLEPCAGDMVNQKEGFAGTCDAYAQEQLAILVRTAKVIFCRAFLTERDASLQDATCFGYYNFPGSLDSVDSLEEQLVSLGALRLSKKPDGSPMRPDLSDAEKTGRGGFGMWADPRVQKQ
ncbi:hypothetical protein C8J36_11478 [Rhizobium sp. PP-F2F-G48]|nr:hypothetical protein [Rhizobium sp. Leaf371]TCM48378.1 hypothetical protein C8J36_11478 [Rhizobium sp. PP-F2F-G48]